MIDSSPLKGQFLVENFKPNPYPHKNEREINKKLRAERLCIVLSQEKPNTLIGSYPNLCNYFFFRISAGGPSLNSEL